MRITVDEMVNKMRIIKRIKNEIKLEELIRLISATLIAAFACGVFFNLKDDYGHSGVSAAGTVTITTMSELVTYSMNYGSSNVNDTINIALASSSDPDKTQYQTTDTSYTYDLFKSIGSTADTAFAGTVYISTEAISYFNFSKPLFGYIKDSAQVIVSGSSGYLELRRPQRVMDINTNEMKDVDLAPVFAEHVIHDSSYSPSEGSYNTWKIKINYYNEPNETAGYPNFTSVVGDVGSNCKIKILVQNDAINGDYIEHVSSSGNAGLVCGTIGESASVVTEITGTNNLYRVTATGGNAGGLVGEMCSGSTLTVTGSDISGGSGRSISASGGYAGGLVGKATEATIVFSSGFTVTESISGSSGAGGIAGFYSAGTNISSFDLSNASINCTVSSGTSSGGLFGRLETTGDFEIDGDNKTYSLTSTAASGPYGGLIGTYKTSALTNTLRLSNLNAVNAKNSVDAAYGGLIYQITSDSAAYIEVSDVTVNNQTTSGSFYGVINSAGNAGHFLNISNFTITGNSYKAGLVGSIDAGVIRLSGITDMSACSATEAQLVGTRGRTLIYAIGDGSTGDWIYKRSSAVTYDDIGTWGEVLRITSSDEAGTIVNYNSSAHTVTVSAAATTMASKNDFIKTALNMQLNAGNIGALQFLDSTNTSSKLLSNTSSLTISGTIDLAGTGIWGLMRDDGKNASGSDAVFSGTITGTNNAIVNLAIGEPYGTRNNATLTTKGNGNGTLHRHANGGLIAVANGATITNLSIGGFIYTRSEYGGMCLGGFVGKSQGDLNLSSIDATVVFTGDSNNGNNSNYFGALVGYATGDGKTISVTGNNHSTMTFNGTNNIYISNGIGCVGNSNLTINYTGYTLGDTSGTTTAASLTNSSNSGANHAYAGGLIGFCATSSDATKVKTKTVKLNDTTIANYSLNINAKASIGGLLGYGWYSTDVEIGVSGSNGLVIDNCDVDQTSTSSGSDQRSGGLLFLATGHWVVNKLKISNTDFNISGIKQYGVLVNRGYYDNSVIFMEITSESGSGNGFDLSDNVNLSNYSSLSVYDELVAYSAYVDGNNNSKVLENGNGIVSIHTANANVVGGKYQNQIALSGTAKYNNEYTRYYYDLDVIRNAVNNISNSGLTTGEQNAYKLMMWSVKKYAYDSIQSYFPVDSAFTISGEFDLSRVSYYPVTIGSNDSISTLGSVTLIFNNETIENSAVAGSTYRSTTSSTSQHNMMHSGLLYDVQGNVTIGGDLTLKGTIGLHTNGSGAIVTGTLGNLTEGTTTFSTGANKNIILDGLRVNNADNTVSTYKPVLINRIGNRVSLALFGVKTATESYSDGNGGVNMAGSSLIGKVGTTDSNNNATSDSIDLYFSRISLDARTDANKSDSDLSGLTDKYGTTQGVFTRATLIDVFIFNNNTNCKGVYNYKVSEDWNGSTAVHNVTYGREISGTAEFVDKQICYVDTADANYTNPVSYSDTQSGPPTYNFQYFLPYVYTRNYDDSDSTKRSREIMVNHTTVDIANGCGTYNDPYIIDGNGQIEVIAKILELDDVSDGFRINVPRTVSNEFKGWCDADHITLEYSSNNGGTYKDTAAGSTYSLTKAQLAKYLAGAYFKITKVTTEIAGEPSYSSIEISSTSFNGWGGNSAEYAFRGVIIGEKNYPIKNHTGAPLIKTSLGCVVKDLAVIVDKGNIELTQTVNSVGFEVGGGCSYYGAIVGQILGGDNFIDNVGVTFSNCSIQVKGAYAKIIPVGGYVGVVANGALIFRNMTGHPSGLTSGVAKDTNNTAIVLSNNDYLYVNPIIGRVINGCAVTESSTGYKYSESSVTMQNGTKNYSIADIDPNSQIAKLDVGAFSGYVTNVSIPNAQAMHILSMLTQCGTLGASKSASTIAGNNSYPSSSYMMMRHANYNLVGTSDNTDYQTYAQYDCYGTPTIIGIKGVPYLVERYTVKNDNRYNAISLTQSSTICNITLTGNETDWYLPDGFRGIGTIGFNFSSSDMTHRIINLHQFEGSGKTIHLNMLMNHYSIDIDNYLPTSELSGFGMFNSVKQNRESTITTDDLNTDSYKIRNLYITGTVNYDVPDISLYNNGNVDKSQYLDVGGFAGIIGFGEAQNIRTEQIDLSGLSVNGFKTAGGLFGNVKLKNDASYTAIIKNITANNGLLSVTSNDYVGGIIGRCVNANITIQNISLTNLSVITYFDGSSYINGVGGIVGYVNSSSNVQTFKLDTITIGSKNATTNLRIGYGPDGEDTTKGKFDDNYHNMIATGGLVGRTNTTTANNSNRISVDISNCKIYNVDLYGYRVGGILGHDTAGDNTGVTSSNISFENIEIFSDNNAIIKGLWFSDNNNLSDTKITYGKAGSRANLADRGCGGIAGFICNKNVIFNNCVVEGYTITSYNDTGGLCGNIQGNNNIYITNVSLRKLSISSCYQGGLWGYLSKTVSGYNVLMDRIQFSKFYNNAYINKGKNHGYLIANKSSVVIKIVGLSRQHVNDDDNKDRLVGPDGFSYGSGGYIIFADTNGACLDTLTTGTINPDFSLGNRTTVAAASPYVNTSPFIQISGTGAANYQYLTGDSLLANYSAANALAGSTLTPNSGVNSANKNNGIAVQNTYLTCRGSRIGDNLYSTYETEMGDDTLPQGVDDFAVIAIDNASANLNDAFNSYVQLLTHTDNANYNFARANNTNVYQIDIKRVEYDTTIHKFVVSQEASPITRRAGSQSSLGSGFEIDMSKPDTDKDVPCFTLVDVQFLNPIEKTEVAYHVYVPILVKKLVSFNFRASSMAGTVYDHDNYVHMTPSSTTEDKWGTPSVTNLGTPVTVYFRYDYTTTVSEWQTMIDSYESLMWRTNKKLLLATGSANIPEGTRMVLVDADNDDRAYFATATSPVFVSNPNSSQNDYFLDLTKFRNGSDYFESLYMGDLLKQQITASTTAHQGGAQYVEAADGEDVYVIAAYGGTFKNFRKPTDAELNDGNVTKYYLSVSGDASAIPAGLTESYYVTFYTEEDAAANLRVIMLSSAPSLISSSEYDTATKHTSKFTLNQSSALIMGNIYQQEITLSTSNPQQGLINNSCNFIENDIDVTVSLNPNCAETVAPYLASGSIKIYHNVLLSLTKTDDTKTENRIYGTPTYSTGNNDNIYGTISSTLDDSRVSPSGFVISPPTNTSSYIQIRENDFDIKPYLLETGVDSESGETVYGGAIVTIHKFRVHFAYSDMGDQFPPRPSAASSNIGTSVTAISVLDSDPANVAFSNIRATADDDEQIKYTTEQESHATLTYVVNNEDEDALIASYNILGINPLDDEDYWTNVIVADGTYNATLFTPSALADKIRWKLSLWKKNEAGEYVQVTDMSDFLDGNIFIADRSGTPTFIDAGNYYYYDEDYTGQMDIMSINTTFAVKTGDDLEALGYEGVYANYKVLLSATLYSGTEPLTGDVSSRVIEHSTPAPDYIIYTNARALYEWVPNT